MDEKDFFSTTITYNSKEYTLHFKKVLLPHGLKYFIEVVSNGKSLASFEMRSNEKSNWKIVQPAAEKWMAMEKKLAELIMQHH
jgi:hypothetical protein